MRIIGVKVKGSGVKLCQGECVRRITLVVTLAGLWEVFSNIDDAMIL